MMDWDKLRVFHAVAEAGSFTHAGESLNLSQSSVSRQIGALEEDLKVTLFHRHARGLILTEQGEELHRTVRDIFGRLNMTVARIKESKERPQGPLKITTTVAFGSIWLTSRMKEFLELYPDIEVSLALADTELDLSMREADVAIRMTAPRQPDLVQRHMITMHYHVFASPEYLKKHGLPRAPEDLDKHPIIVYGDQTGSPLPDRNWLLKAGAKPENPRQPILKVNSTYGIYRAVQAGLGIAALPDYISQEGGNLVKVLPELHGPRLDCYFVYPEELRQSQKIIVFRDFLLRKVADANL
jgi:DNA-binding transcriptional LysR family regulator